MATGQTATKSFVTAFLACLGITALVIMTRFFIPERIFDHILGMTLILIIAFGITALMRGAVATGLGCIIVGGGMLAIGFLMEMLHY